jgi:hypothetical protein
MRIFSVTNFQPIMTILSHLGVFLFWWAVAERDAPQHSGC